ncbi:MAG: T9SS type A sorting domain-containing protein [Ignavibacteriaceae bacterium]|nr:T9SS type A sorting domain-containing protein [Ignavibacteriaceae bacterium]
MKIKLYLLLFILSIMPSVMAQEYFSPHYYDKQLYKNYEVPVTDEPGKIIPLQWDKSAVANYWVFGYLPYWEYPGGMSNLKYEYLTHIGAFDFEADSLGNLSNPSGWPWTNLINTAHQNGVKVILVVTNFTNKEIRRILSNADAKQNLFSQIKNKIEAYQLDGVNIDFEGLYTADRGTLLNTFMSELTAYITANLPGKTTTFAAPPVNWSGWDFTGLANACDYVFIMGYDFYGSFSSTSGPSAPYLGGSYNIYNTITQEWGNIANSNPKKLILGVPYFGPEFKTATGEAGSQVTGFVRSVRFREALPNSATYGLLFNTTWQTTWYRYTQGTQWYQAWFDDPRSSEFKFTLAKSKNLKGVGMWALNYDGTLSDYWNKIRDIFFTGTSAGELPENYELKMSSYPNPFNPSSVLEIISPSQASGKITVYDIAGQKVRDLGITELSQGRNHLDLDMSGMVSGVYFVRLEFEGAQQSRNIIHKVVLSK